MAKLSAGLLLLMLSVSLQAQDHAERMLAAIRNWGAVRPPEIVRIEFAVTPPCERGDENWKVIGVRFDQGLHAWVVQTSCKGSTVPFLAIVHVDDPRWLRERAKSRRAVPILVRAGERKELTVKFPGGRIREPVVCLRNGRAGEVIRVRSLDRKLVRRALVSEAGDLILAGGQ